MKEPELKPCPFCGKTVANLTNCIESEDCAFYESCAEPPFVCVVCNAHNGGCGASGGYADSAEEAIEKWNHRHAPENKPLTIEQLKQMDEEPIYLVYPSDPSANHWEIIYLVVQQYGLGEEWVRMTSGASEPAASYGKTWLAYTRKPEVNER